MEQLLHYIWKHKIFPLKRLETTDGMEVEVIDPGLSNTDSGPDFFNAKVKINGTLWIGNVEIHSKTSDWFKHGHDTNKVYDTIILHVAEEIDCELRRENHELIPQLKLVCPPAIKQNYDTLLRNDLLPVCHPILKELPLFSVHSWLTVLQSERLEHKSQAIKERLKLCNGHWESAFFITLARNFGFGLNGDAFEKWASILSFRAIDKYRNHPFQIEALFFGQAGLLQESLQDVYYQRLQKEFVYLQKVFDLPIMDASLWKFLRLRPTNFPHVRIAQLSTLYAQRWGLFSQLMEADSLVKIKDLLRTATSSYWEEHYHFYDSSPHRTKTLSQSTLHLVIINTVVPFLYAYGTHRMDDVLCCRASTLLEELKAEENYIIRMWREVGINASNAADSQALIELKKEYCDQKKCLYCRFGFEYLKRHQ